MCDCAGQKPDQGGVKGLSARRQRLIQVVKNAHDVAYATDLLRTTPLSTHVDILVVTWPEVYLKYDAGER